MPRISLHLLSLTLFLIPALVFAQETGTGVITDTGTGSVTGTGATTGSGALSGSAAILQQLLEQQQERDRWQQRKDENADFWGSMMNQRKTVAAYYKQATANRANRAVHRRNCRREIRRANRDTKFPTTLRCFRGDLMLNLEKLRKEQQYINDRVGIADSIKQEAFQSIETLMDALFTIVNAIDASVYHSTEGLQEAKKNLDHLYRKHKRLTIIRVRISHTIRWTSHLIIRTHDVLVRRNPSEEVASKLNNVIDCFESKKGQLESLLAIEDNNESSEQFRQVQSDIKFCTAALREARDLNTQLEQAAAENAEEEE